MRVVFTYLPIRLKEVTEIYLKYTIENLNTQKITPIIYSDKDYFKGTNLKYDWVEFDIDIKQRLVDGLMQELFKTKCIEFTKSQDVYLGEHYYRARMFVVPDDQVRILRVSQINNIPT